MSVVEFVVNLWMAAYWLWKGRSVHPLLPQLETRDLYCAPVLIVTKHMQMSSCTVGLQTTRDLWFCSFDQPPTKMPPRRSAAATPKAKPVRSTRSTRSAVSVTDWSTTQDEFVPICFGIAISDNNPIRESAVNISRYMPQYCICMLFLCTFVCIA